MSSSVKSVRMSALFAFVATVAVVASALIGTNAASADQVQVQSYQRVSQSEACAAQPGETPWQASWGADPSWSPSWEQWANAGTGGWVCTRSITWAQDAGARIYNVGDIGPGGGLVFLISGGKTYEMALKTWRGAGTPDAKEEWCSDTNSDITGAVGTEVGTGSANTTAMQSPACTSGAGVSARAYRGGGFYDWFLPSEDELNAMCNYSRNPSAPAAPSVSCYGTSGTDQNATFARGDYGFVNDIYWTSSQFSLSSARFRDMNNGNFIYTVKVNMRQVRPIRAF